MPFPIIATGVAGLLWGFGAKTGSKGLSDFTAAKKQLNDTKERHEINIARFQLALESVTDSMEMLGKTELNVAKDFNRFSYIFEKIKNRPEFSEQKTNAKIPEFDFQDIKTASVNANESLRMGKAIGIFVTSVAAGGIGLLAGGTILASAGKKAKERADEAFGEMLKSEVSINTSIIYMNQVQSTARKLEKAIIKVNKIYNKYVTQLERLAKENCEWDTYDYEERLLVENTILIVSVLHNMINTPLLRTTNTHRIGEPTLDRKGVNQVIDSSLSSLSKSGVV